MGKPLQPKGMCAHHHKRRAVKLNLCMECWERARHRRQLHYQRRQGMTHNEADGFLARKVQEESLPHWMRTNG